MNEECLICHAPLEYLPSDVLMECALCHRKELNHSARFWAEVERILPDHKERRKWLREHGNALMARIS